MIDLIMYSKNTFMILPVYHILVYGSTLENTMQKWKYWSLKMYSATSIFKYLVFKWSGPAAKCVYNMDDMGYISSNVVARHRK